MSEKKLNVKVWIDKDFLQSTKGSGELLTCLEKANVTTIIEKLPVSNSILWTRVDAAEETQHNHILVKMETDAFVDHVAEFMNLEKRHSNSLTVFLAEIKKKAQVDSVTFLVNQFKQYYKSSSSSKAASKTKSKKVGKQELGQAIIRLEMEHNVSVRSYETVEELKDVIMCYSKSISEYASKHEQAENLLFCDKAVDKAQTKVKDGQGLINLWKELIETFPLVSGDQAQAICSAHPSPLLLKKVCFLLYII